MTETKHRKRSDKDLPSYDQRMPVIPFRLPAHVKKLLNEVSKSKDVYVNYLVNQIVTEWLIREGHLSIDGEIINK